MSIQSSEVLGSTDFTSPLPWFTKACLFAAKNLSSSPLSPILKLAARSRFAQNIDTIKMKCHRSTTGLNSLTWGMNQRVCQGSLTHCLPVVGVWQRALFTSGRKLCVNLGCWRVQPRVGTLPVLGPAQEQPGLRLQR